MQVRRLTPVECERLQGIPDNHLNVLYKGKPLADGPKYRLCGNSFAIPVVRWIGERIQKVDTLLLNDQKQRNQSEPEKPLLSQVNDVL